MKPKSRESQNRANPSASPIKPKVNGFVAPSASALSFRDLSLEQYLKQAGFKAPFIVGDILDAQDWSHFEKRYKFTGRPPYAPRNMMGLILYGVMQGVTSLRALEQMARSDLCCMWVSGGIHPDHASIGNFINKHATSLSGEFFNDLVRTILRKSQSSVQTLAGDGTALEAACSYYKLIKEDAARMAVDEAKKQLAENPDEAIQQAQLEQATKVLNALLDVKKNDSAAVEKQKR